MPWDGRSFASKHNHALHGAAASKAASIASAILKSGGDEGVAIATANKYAAKHRADGGSSDIAAALRIAHRDAGGFTPPIIPGFERQEDVAIARSKPYGFKVGTGGGRSDINDVSVAPSSYVIPADIIAGLGDGNSLAGAKVWDQILTSMPFGIQAPRATGHRGPPTPPHDASLMQGITGTTTQPHLASGGEAGAIPIRMADGEVTLSPDDVLRIGSFYSPAREQGDRAAMIRRGHRVLDAWIKHERGRNIKHLKGLKGPVGSRNASKGHT